MGINPISINSMAPIYSKVDGSDPYCLQPHNMLSAAKNPASSPFQQHIACAAVAAPVLGV